MMNSRCSRRSLISDLCLSRLIINNEFIISLLITFLTTVIVLYTTLIGCYFSNERSGFIAFITNLQYVSLSSIFYKSTK